MENIAGRLRNIIEFETQEIATRRFQWLANHSAVTSEAWRSFWNGKQRPSAEMIESAGTIWPNYAFWLVTGLPDPKFGHQSPHTLLTLRKKKAEFDATNEYFKEALLNKKDSKQIEVEELEVLKKTELLSQQSDRSNEIYKRVDLLEQIRWVDIFLDNYILELPIDETIGSYNSMRGVVKKIESYGSAINDDSITKDLLQKFIFVKEQIEKRRDWIIESTTQRAKDNGS